jgi:hypothetical protein
VLGIFGANRAETDAQHERELARHSHCLVGWHGASSSVLVIFILGHTALEQVDVNLLTRALAVRKLHVQFALDTVHEPSKHRV